MNCKGVFDVLLWQNDLYLFFFIVVFKDFDFFFCLIDVFICKSVKFCVVWKQICDGVLYCDDGSDEIDCVIVLNFKQLGILYNFILFMYFLVVIYSNGFRYLRICYIKILKFINFYGL